jgi:hypothetical protein
MHRVTSDRISTLQAVPQGNSLMNAISGDGYSQSRIFSTLASPFRVSLHYFMTEVDRFLELAVEVACPNRMRTSLEERTAENDCRGGGEQSDRNENKCEVGSRIMRPLAGLIARVQRIFWSSILRLCWFRPLSRRNCLNKYQYINSLIHKRSAFQALV